VSNTFGDRHSYLCAHDDHRPITREDTLSAQKVFHVSPFQPIEGGYTFRFDIREDRVGVWIDYGTGNEGLYATLTGKRAALTRGRSWASLRRPLRRAACLRADPLAGAEALVEGRALSCPSRTARTRGLLTWTADGPPARVSLPGYAVFAAMLSAAGLPIYIHAPAYYATSYGVGLTALAGVLFALAAGRFGAGPGARLAVGAAERTARDRGGCRGGAAGRVDAGPVRGGAAGPAAHVVRDHDGRAVFRLLVPHDLHVCRGRAGRGSVWAHAGHLKLAGWRETGALLGVCAAAAAPTLLEGTGAPYAGFAVGFAPLPRRAVLMRGQWGRAADVAPTGFREILSDSVTRRLLLIALMNAAPVAVSSTVFLFFVGSVLDAEGWEGGLLILYFLAAAGRSRLVPPRGTVRGTSGPSGGNGARDRDLFAGPDASGRGRRHLCGHLFRVGCLDRRRFRDPSRAFRAPHGGGGARGGAAFGLWAFVQKAALALAAATMLPALDAAGFSAAAGPENSAEALQLLTWLYALVPCILKLGAMALLAMTPLPAPQPATA
jgi:GPH family glycoside/pentoside/hexuronide:cation symporter